MRLIDIEAPCKIEIVLDGEKCHATVTAPTIDAVPVVRCKDCKRWKDSNDGECPYHLTGDPYIDDDPEEDFFCAYGERKDDGAE